MIENIRLSCEDARVFIRASVIRALCYPFDFIGEPRPKIEGLWPNKFSNVSSPLENTGLKAQPLNHIAHYVMNLPDSAIKFLDAFHGLLNQSSCSRMDFKEIYSFMPMVHCYCFTRCLDAEKAKEDIKEVSC